MLVGHIAVGLAAKRITPRVSAGTTVAAAVLPDLLWCTFLLAGIEHVELKPGRGAVNYFGASDIALSHSLLMDAICVSRGLLLRASLCPRRVDTVRRRDKPLGAGFRGSSAGYGVGAGRPSLFRIGALEFGRGNRHRGRWDVGGRHRSLRARHACEGPDGIAGPPPLNVRAMAIGSLIFFACVVAWDYWMNRLRPACYNSV